jgi:ABC-2 type transport system ATP-binding protein
MSVIEAHDLSKRFGDVIAVDHLSFSVRSGAVTGFLGPNGAGKTTTLRILLGLASPNGGSATILGGPYRDLTDPLKRVGALLDGTMFHPARTARNGLRVNAMAAGLPTSRVDEVLKQVDLTSAAGRKVGGFSMGMRQRLGLANALLGDPELLVLDEPANGLDPEGIRWLRELLRSLAGEGRAIFISSHVLAEVAQMVDDVVIVNHGRLLASGSQQELINPQAAEVIVRSPKQVELADALRQRGLTVAANDGTLMVRGATAASIGDLAHAQGIPLHELRSSAPSLEEIFFDLTEEQGVA